MPKIEDMPKIQLPEAESPTPVVVNASSQHPQPVSTTSKFNGLSRKAWIIIGAGGIFLLFLLFFLIIPFLSIRVSATRLSKTAKELEQAASAQNIAQVKTSLAKSKKDLSSLDGDINKLVWARFLPFLGGYWQDAKHLTKGSKAGLEAADVIVEAVEPYSDILGLNGAHQAEDGTKTAEERINFVVDTLEGVIPKMDTIAAKTSVMAGEFSKINVDHYPEYFAGKPVRSKVKTVVSAAKNANDLMTNGKPVLKQLPYLLGTKEERTYLVLWQNDKELRPTGGFITAYSIVKVNKGKFEPVVSDDIYHLDNQFKSRIPAPEPILKYLPLVPYWNLRDMNLSPDFKVSMDTFYKNYLTIKKAQPVDGIISVDTYPLVGLLSVMGQLGVSGFGNFSAEEEPKCSCPNVIYQLESYADVAGPIVWDDITGKIVYKPPHADNRKAFLGPLMNTLVANAMGQPKDKLPGLFDVAWNTVSQKHTLFYMTNPEVQSALEAFNLAGRVQESKNDYLYINDSNFAGAKSNLYVQEEVILEVSQAKDGATNTLTVKYKNPQKYDGWLNGPFRDWFRVYVPKGSKFVDSTGSDVPITTSEDLGKTVFEGFFTLRPLGVTELHFKYKTPVKQKDYKILIQKQPGTEGNQYAVKLGKKKEEFKLSTDKELSF